MCYILGRGKTKAFILLLQSFSKSMFLAGLEPATFRVWGERDNHYTTETCHTWIYFNMACRVSLSDLTQLNSEKSENNRPSEFF